MYRYGYWRRYTQLLHATSVPLRVLVPPVFLGALALSLALLPTPLRSLSVFVPGAYAVFLAAAALRASLQIGADAIAVPVALATMHFSYGWGWWRAFVKFGLERRKVRDATIPLV